MVRSQAPSRCSSDRQRRGERGDLQPAQRRQVDVQALGQPLQPLVGGVELTRVARAQPDHAAQPDLAFVGRGEIDIASVDDSARTLVSALRLPEILPFGQPVIA